MLSAKCNERLRLLHCKRVQHNIGIQIRDATVSCNLEIIESKCTALEVLERKLLDAEVERNRLRMINEDLLQALLYVLHTSCV